MTNIRQIHRYMTDRQRVVLQDGRVGKIVRVDTEYPNGSTIVSIWTDSPKGPAVTKVNLDSVVGPALETNAA